MWRRSGRYNEVGALVFRMSHRAAHACSHRIIVPAQTFSAAPRLCVEPRLSFQRGVASLMIRANYRQSDNHPSAAERQLCDAAPASTAAASEAGAPQTQTTTQDLFATSRQSFFFFFFPECITSGRRNGQRRRLGRRLTMCRYHLMRQMKAAPRVAEHVKQAN